MEKITAKEASLRRFFFFLGKYGLSIMHGQFCYKAPTCGLYLRPLSGQKIGTLRNVDMKVKKVSLCDEDICSHSLDLDLWQEVRWNVKFYARQNFSFQYVQKYQGHSDNQFDRNLGASPSARHGNTEENLSSVLVEI